MDGMHRVLKALMRGESHILAVRFLTDPEPDFVGVDPDDLPYDEEPVRSVRVEEMTSHSPHSVPNGPDAAPCTVAGSSMGWYCCLCEAFTRYRPKWMVGYSLLYSIPSLCRGASPGCHSRKSGRKYLWR
jgi:hypothetical protein